LAFGDTERVKNNYSQFNYCSNSSSSSSSCCCSCC